MISSSLQIASANNQTVNLGPDQTLLIGDSLTISPVLSFNPDSFYWTGDVDVIDVNLLVNLVVPQSSFSVSLFAFDDKGCLYSDDLNVNVLLSSAIYVPNVFSPNNDGINDIVAPFTDPSIVSIEYFEIYSRWGEKVFSATDFVPNSGDGQWDGTLDGKELNPGVFAYILSATNKKGQVLILNGNITLVR
jgi:gliding motility-associated-like protein